jgi:hypothetical protein
MFLGSDVIILTAGEAHAILEMIKYDWPEAKQKWLQDHGCFEVVDRLRSLTRKIEQTE